VNTFKNIAAADLIAVLADQSCIEELYKQHAVKVDVEFQKFHAPHGSARKGEGYGKTLCGVKGVRGPNVTCERCIRSLEKVAKR
jgi:hypothetical protein